MVPSVSERDTNFVFICIQITFLSADGTSMKKEQNIYNMELSSQMPELQSAKTTEN